MPLKINKIFVALILILISLIFNFFVHGPVLAVNPDGSTGTAQQDPIATGTATDGSSPTSAGGTSTAGTSTPTQLPSQPAQQTQTTTPAQPKIAPQATPVLTPKPTPSQQQQSTAQPIATPTLATATSQPKNNSKLIWIVSTLGALLLAALGFSRLNRSKDQGPCDSIKNQLNLKEAELQAHSKKLSIQQVLVDSLKAQLDDLKYEMQDRAIEKAAEKTERLLVDAEQNLLAKGVDIGQTGYGVYQSLQEKYELAQQALELLKSKHAQLSAEAQGLQTAYDQCMLANAAPQTAASMLAFGLSPESKNYLIEGLSGTGKSTVCAELKKRGYNAIEADQMFGYYGDPKTDQPDADQQQSHWIWNKEKIQDALNQNLEIIFVCGGAANQDQFSKYFKKSFVLQVDDHTLKSRLLNRTNNDFGKKADDLARQLQWNQGVANYAKETGKILIDATRPVSEVVDQILRNLD